MNRRFQDVGQTKGKDQARVIFAIFDGIDCLSTNPTAQGQLLLGHLALYPILMNLIFHNFILVKLHLCQVLGQQAESFFLFMVL